MYPWRSRGRRILRAQYVQDAITEKSAIVADLLADENSYFYICGHKRMEDGVNESLSKIAEANGINWEELRDQLRRRGRYHVETYY